MRCTSRVTTSQHVKNLANEPVPGGDSSHTSTHRLQAPDPTRSGRHVRSSNVTYRPNEDGSRYPSTDSRGLYICVLRMGMPWMILAYTGDSSALRCPTPRHAAETGRTTDQRRRHLSLQPGAVSEAKKQTAHVQGQMSRPGHTT